MIILLSLSSLALIVSFVLFLTESTSKGLQCLFVACLLALGAYKCYKLPSTYTYATYQTSTIKNRQTKHMYTLKVKKTHKVLSLTKIEVFLMVEDELILLETNSACPPIMSIPDNLQWTTEE